MTRVLAELLGAPEPAFRAGLKTLERASGHESTDIRLTADIVRASQQKLHSLGLDKYDTTATELYAALGARLAADEQRLFATLRQKYNGADDISSAAKELANVPIPKSCFALKSTVARRLLRKQTPKRAMKALGYRSIESLLKHESVAHIYAACALSESATWHKQLLDSYKKLKANDFEIRKMMVLHPDTARWLSLTETSVAARRHNVLSFKELGVVVMLPLPSERPPAAAMTSLLLALHEMNSIRSASTYLKLCQVRPDFGTILQQVAASEPQLAASVFGQPLSWQVVQRYYGRFADRFRSELFEPHVQIEDLTWHSIEKVLSYIEPSLEFWQHTTHLGLLHEHQTVSFNIIDVAINYCNNLPFENRLMNYCRQSLWHELVIRYLKHDNVEQSVVGNLQSELMTQTEIA